MANKPGVANKPRVANKNGPTPKFPFDLQYIDVALALAGRGLGNVWPNPAVGCVIVRHGHVVGRGWTQPGGRPHAETQALKQAGDRAKEATAYVSLEPCAHQGGTPPCADALIRAGISAAVIAVQDPDPRVAGAGIARLQNAGIEVMVGVRQAEAIALNAGFFSRIEKNRPFITLKLATSLDGRIAAKSGDSKWITGDDARAAAHLLRAQHDAVMVGSGTIVADDPELTCRLPGMQGRQGVRIVLDSRLRITPAYKFAADAKMVASWIVTAQGCDPAAKKKLEEIGVKIIEAPTGPDRHIDSNWTVQHLAIQGLTRILVEGGGDLAAALLKADLVDQITWFRAPAVIGGDGIPAIRELGTDKIADAARFDAIGRVQIGTDWLETYRRIA